MTISTLIRSDRHHAAASPQPDITRSELAIETSVPADELTAQRLRNMAAGLK